MQQRSGSARALMAIMAVLAALFATAAPAAATHPGVLSVTITKVVNIGDEGIEDNLRGEADMYAVVVIDGATGDSKGVHQDDKDSVEPLSGWTFSKDFGGGAADSVGVKIEIWDHDGCDPARCSVSPDPFGESDDQGDVDPGGDNSVDLVVDRVAGTWSGDTSNPDTCSQGTGDSAVLVCWDISIDSASGDADGDGLLDGWERRGLDADGDGTVDVDLPAFGADPLHKDLFLELDYETGQTPTRADIQAMKAAFRVAPLSNPDGVNGVNLWVDTGNLVDTSAREGQVAGTCMDGIDNGGDGLIDGGDSNDCNFLDASVEDPQAGNCTGGADNDGDGLIDAADPDCLVGDDLGGGSAVTVTGACNLDPAYFAAKAANFDADRKWVFRYSVSLNLETACARSGGWGELGGNDFMDFNHDGGTLMHELGHTLNLDHGGNEGNNCKPNYVSVMNYDNQFNIRRTGGGNILDYAPPRDSLNGADRGVAPLPQLRENDLDDGLVLDGTDASNRFVFVDTTGTKVAFDLDAPANWNSDTDPPTEANQTVNIDTSGTNGRPSACTNAASNSTLNGFNDWASLSLPFRQFGDSASGAINPIDHPNPTLDELIALEQEVNSTDLSIAISDSPDPVAAGTQLTYTATATNHGPSPATSVTITETLPSDVTFASASASCDHAAGVVTCNIGELAARESDAITITVDVPADLVYDHGGPKTITTTATVVNNAGDDTDPANNTDSESTQVVAVADVSITSVTTTSPLEVLIGEPAQATVAITTANAGPSSPIDAVLGATTSTDAGATVSPTTTNENVTALTVGTPQTTEQTFTIACDAPGVKTIEFDYQLTLANAADTDPDLSNNTRSADFDIECVVPIAINIRPGGSPNSVNLRTDATVAALTTAAGEYGLPLAFDATSIVIETVRYGVRSNLFNVGTASGAKEIHNELHVEDSYELDEQTRDGDLDGVIHFKPADSGMTLTTTEGCLKGRFTFEGATYAFLGCDAVRVVR